MGTLKEHDKEERKMRKKVKKYVVLFLSVCLVCAGCTSKSNSSNENTNKDSAVQKTESEVKDNEIKDKETKEEEKKPQEKAETSEEAKVISPEEKTQKPEKEAAPEPQKEITLEPTDNSNEILAQETEEETSNNEQEAVTGVVQLYAGNYRDERCFGDNPECPETPCIVEISNITDTSFDFTIKQYDRWSSETNVIFLTNTAVFTGDGTTATFFGQQYTLQFTFPDYYSALPIVVSMEISGFEPVEGATYSNNGIPGHEFS